VKQSKWPDAMHEYTKLEIETVYVESYSDKEEFMD
jgi:hypothetical protein